MNTRIEQFKWVLVDAIFDLVTPATVFREYKNSEKIGTDNQKFLGIARMCNSHTIIALAKLDEAINHFGKEIKSFPEPLKLEIKKIKIAIEKKGVYQFRSQYVAHTFNNEGGNKAPLKIEDGYKLLTAITGDNLDIFYQWIYPIGEDGDESQSVVSVVVKMRDHCIRIVGSSQNRL